MEIRRYLHHVVVLGLLGLTAVALRYGVDVRYVADTGIRTDLPDRAGDWTGEDLFYCTNAACAPEYRASQLAQPGICPTCGGPLDTASPGERPYLPADTSIRKRVYRTPFGQEVYVSIVLSGRDRSSIHRPQLCLAGQGHEIVRSHVVRVPAAAAGAKDARIMVLDLDRRGRDAGGRGYVVPTYFAYWFVGPGRETPYHLQRMIWMATDRLFRSRSTRWSYIAVSGRRTPGSDEHWEEVQAFVAALHPQLVAL